MQGLRLPTRVLQAKPIRVARRGALQIRAAITSNDFKTGLSIEIDGAPWRVVEFLHVKPGKGAAFVRSKLKNYINGNVMERTFRAGEPVELATVEKREMQFTYTEGDEYTFMDMESFEETKVKRDEAWARFLKEGLNVQVIKWNGRTIGVEMPIAVELKVTSTDPGVRGNTQSGGSKPATLETGAVISVPLFINEGELLKINTETGEYLGRVN